MAKLSGHRKADLAAALALVVLCAHASADAADAGSVDLIGTWHVLIHYTDDHAHDPEQLRWDDKIWVFEESGSRLRWTEYPIVVFQDQTGRFERVAGVGVSRVLHAWEPNESQRAEIASGLGVNSRGSKSKTLRKRGDDWRSTTRPTAASASIVSYVESWSIESASGKPVFRREDTLGSATMESLEGVTLYTTTEATADGAMLRGVFERDGSRHGTFRMLRAREPRAVEGRAKGDRQHFYREDLSDFAADVAKIDAALYEAVQSRARGGGEIPEKLRERAGSSIRGAIEQGVRGAGNEPRNFKPQVDSLTGQIEKLVVDEGHGFEEVEQMIRDGRLTP